MKMETFSSNVSFCADIKKCDDSKDKSAFINFREKYTSSLSSDCKPWKIKDIALLSVGYFAILDSANTRLKVFDHEFVHVTSKIVQDSSHSLASLQGERIYVMDNTAVHYYRFREKKLSFEDKFDLTGMHYDICSNGVILCLTKLTSLEFKDHNFNTLNTVNFKSTLGYAPDHIAFDQDNNLVFFNNDSKCVVCCDKFQEETYWRVNDVDTCVGIQRYGNGWMFVGNRELTFVDRGGRTFVQRLKEPELEECICIGVDVERHKLYLSDRTYVYEYDICTST